MNSGNGRWRFTESGLFDPCDALVDLESRPEARKHLVTRLRRQVRKSATEYGDKITELVRLTEGVLEACDDHARTGKRFDIVRA
jgi:hypothetical protein